MLFISPEKLFSFVRYSNYCPDLFSHVRKWLARKTNVNFKIYDLTAWETNTDDTHITRYLKK